MPLLPTPAAPVPRRGGTPAALLAARVAGDGARPLLTAYDATAAAGPPAGGERVELSATTLDNWVAKTANLLQDELGVTAGARVGVDLPAHWQAAVWVLACWSLGAVVEPARGAEPPDVAVTGPDGLAAALAGGAGEVVALALRPLGGTWPGPLPAGVVDYAAVVPGHGDRFAPLQRPAPSWPALSSGRTTHTLGGLVDLATERAAALALGERPRLLTSAAPATPRGALEAVLLPLVTGGSAVLLRGEVGVDDPRLAGERLTRDLRG